MKKIIALAVLGLAVTACDPYNDPKAASAIKYQLVTGRNADTDSLRGGTMDGPWVADDADITSLVSTPNHGTFGRVIVLTFDGLLDGSSVEQTAQSCLPLPSTWTFTQPAATVVAGAVWYTCYYPSSATATDGGSVYVYYSTVAPGPSTGAQPIRAGRLAAADYDITGTVKSTSGASIPVHAAISVGEVLVSSADADDVIAPSETNAFTAAYQNRTAAQTTWTFDAVDATTGGPVTGAAAGTIGTATGVDNVTYTAPATVPAPDGIFVTVTATANRLSNSYTIQVAP
jgi:hypothetical protein